MYVVGGLLICYLILCVVAAMFQRQLLYPATRAESLPVDSFPELRRSFEKLADVEFPSHDEAIVRGWHLQVQSTPSEQLILLLHGNGGHRAFRTRWYELASSLRTDLLTIDYHGYGDSEGTPSEPALISDAKATWEHAVSKLGYSPSKIVILGESLGGGVGVQLAAIQCRRNQAPAGLILSATFSSMVETASRKFPWLPVRLMLQDRYHSDRHIPEVNSPLLQFHGADDALVPLSLGQRLHELAPAKSASGIPKSMIVFPETGHNNVLRQNADAMRTQIADFLRRL
jgi:pimeloyl-ACP methyl ester carboxylesterase